MDVSVYSRKPDYNRVQLSFNVWARYPVLELKMRAEEFLNFVEKSKVSNTAKSYRNALHDS